MIIEAAAKTPREQADQWIAEGDAQKAAAVLREMWRAESSSASASFIATRFDRIREQIALQPHRVAVLRSFTVEPVVPLLRAGAFVAGMDLAVQLGEFNAYVQEFVDPSSSLYSFQPDTVILALEARDAAPQLWKDWSHLAADEAKREAAALIDRFAGWVTVFRKYSQANLILHSLAIPETPSLGVLDAQLEIGQAETLQEVNRGLRQIAREQRGVYMLDYDALVARFGRARWRDERKWLTVRMAFSSEYLAAMAQEWMRFLHPLIGKVAKAVAVDLDNTLWGGVVGEDGFHGIKISGEYPGAAYLEVQRALLDLRQRGILLALCSKNNPAEAMEVLTKHPDMLLRPEHFAAARVNWNDKATNLREIASELNIGIDSVAFLDDNPVERQQIRLAVPEVHVLELPADPLQFARVIRDAPVFERLTLSTEDLQRSDMYRAEQKRQELESAVGSREDFYCSLQQEAEIGRVSAATVARIAQLTQKTNQFNLTTRRYTEQQIAELGASPDWRVYWVRVRDRFSDNGLVGVAILRASDAVSEGRAVWEIDTLLMSCRVIGRTVETAFLAYLIEEATAAGAQALEGWFLPTKKNTPAKDFYAAHGFRPAEETEQGTRWKLEFPQNAVRYPEWIRVSAPQEAS